MTNKTILIGAGGHAKVVMNCLSKAYGFIDDAVDEFLELKKVMEVQNGYEAIISFGAVTVEGLQRRQEVFTNYKSQQISFVRAIHKSAIIAPDVLVGEGTMIGPGAIINPGALIGSNVIINSGAIIEHDVIIGDGSHVAPGSIILGEAEIGKTTMIGAGAVILPKAKVADETLVKALTRY